MSATGSKVMPLPAWRFVSTNVLFAPILLQKSAAADRRSAISLKAAGVDLPTLAPSSPPQK
jgi:hypothetical protein